jgi:trehalose-phosphatase
MDENEFEDVGMTRYLFDDMWSIGEQIARAELVLLCMEFDGVVAPEQEEESLVSLSPQMQRVLWSLANQERRVMAFLSHRSRMELQMRIGLPNVWYAGCHGLEISGPGSVSIHPMAAVHSRQLQPVAALLNNRLRSYPEVECQDRGLTLRIPLHDQPASVVEQVRHLTQDLVRQMAPMCRIVSETNVLEVRPAVSWNRAAAAKWIQQQLDPPEPLLVYLGREDEGAFHSLEDALTIRIGESEKSAAQYYLAGPPDVRRFLEWVSTLARDPQGVVAAASREG